MDELERNILCELQHDLPVVARPFAEIASRIGISEINLLSHIETLRKRGLIRKISATIHHRRAGFSANALCVWQVPDNQLEMIGEMFAALPVVTHCYERVPHPEWPYTLYTMVHATCNEECEQHIAAMRSMSGIELYQVLYSTKELKKSRMCYFD